MEIIDDEWQLQLASFGTGLDGVLRLGHREAGCWRDRLEFGVLETLDLQGQGL